MDMDNSSFKVHMCIKQTQCKKKKNVKVPKEKSSTPKNMQYSEKTRGE